jgi:hypothetical protein
LSAGEPVETIRGAHRAVAAVRLPTAQAAAGGIEGDEQQQAEPVKTGSRARSS